MQKRGKLIAWGALLAAGTGLGLALGGAARAAGGQAVLATPEQRAAETMLLKLLADPDIQAAQKVAADRLIAETPEGKMPAGRARAAHDVAAWTGGLIMRWLSGDPEKPVILLSTDNTPRTWLGRNIPATGAAADNPDHIYRNSFIDGAGRYEIRGRFDPKRRPIQFSIEASRGTPGRLMLSPAATGTKVRNQLDMVTDKDLQIGTDGRFTIQVGPDVAEGPNSLRTEPGVVTLILRDVVSDWPNEVPAELSIRRLDRPDGKPADYETVKRRVLTDLPEYIAFWGRFPQMFQGGIPVNGLKGPLPRDGGWGYQGSVRYQLEPGQGLAVTLERGGAAYLGFQVCDPYLLGVDARAHVTSLSGHQATPNPDGSFTYVISADDLGVANWLDTGGLREGIGVIRFQAMAPGASAEGLVRDVKLVDREALDRDYPAVPRLTPAEREAQRRQHAADYALRWQR